MDQELITQAELARRLGVTRQYINKLVRDGKIQKVGKKIDYESACESIKMITDPARSKISEDKKEESVETPMPAKNSGGKRPPTFAEAKTMKEIYSAKLAKLKYEEEAQILIKKSDIYEKAHIVGRNIKQVLLSLPARVMEQLAVETDPRKVNQILEKEVRDSLSSLEEELKRM